MQNFIDTTACAIEWWFDNLVPSNHDLIVRASPRAIARDLVGEMSFGELLEECSDVEADIRLGSSAFPPSMPLDDRVPFQWWGDMALSPKPGSHGMAFSSYDDDDSPRPTMGVIVHWSAKVVVLSVTQSRARQFSVSFEAGDSGEYSKIIFYRRSEGLGITEQGVYSDAREYPFPRQIIAARMAPTLEAIRASC